MHQRTKPIVQISFTLMLTTIVLLLSGIIIDINRPLPLASAQEPPDDPQPSLLVNEETLAAFGLSAEDLLQVSTSLIADLKITKYTNVFSVTSGTPVTFTISITNYGPNLASGAIFKDEFPPEMRNVEYIFSTEAISNNESIPSWLFTDPIPVNSTVVVTITGVLTSASNVTVKNTATITFFNPTAELAPGDNRSEVSINITGYNPSQPGSSKVYYLPIIFKSPPVVVVYSDNFSNSGSGWYKGYSDDDHCYSYYESGRYRINLDKSSRSCWRPAPAAANRVYGSFQVDAYHSEGNSNASFGIYSNGQGGNVYYLFRIWPNNSCSSGGGWELLRNGSRKLGNSGACHSAIHQGYGYASGATNTLKITHTKDGKISVYANGTLLGTYPDSAQLTGNGTGVYAYSSNVNIVIKFDNFKVFTVP
jgi:uncharacterized repeat protein (TIGR01451 family)